MQDAMWSTPVGAIFMLGQDSSQVRQVPIENSRWHTWCWSAGRFGDQGMMTSVEETTRTDVTGIPSR